MPLSDLPIRTIGPPTIPSGTGFFEYFLPLMAILGDIIEVHHRRRHPRLGSLDDSHSVAVITKLLSDFELGLGNLATDISMGGYTDLPTPGGMNGSRNNMANAQQLTPDQSRVRLVKAYSTHILHVLHVLLHGKWDAISMLDDGDDWITSKRFTECAAHAISASQSVSTILTIDPELTFMSYLFGIYLLQGSFILLLFADRMPQLGPNESVEQACENIIRAHEVCVVTLSTEFQVICAARMLFPRRNTNNKLYRKTSARWCDLHCIAFVAQELPTGRSTELAVEHCHCTDGLKAPKAWVCNIN